MRPPNYVIHRKGFPDGREQFTVEVGRFLWWRIWLKEWCDSLSWSEPGYMVTARFNTREQARAAIKAHWAAYISSLPAMLHETIQYDPEQQHEQ